MSWYGAILRDVRLLLRSPFFARGEKKKIPKFFSPPDSISSSGAGVVPVLAFGNPIFLGWASGGKT